jgi:hypothetical protein
MAKHLVTLYYSATYTQEVEADSPAQAKEAALNLPTPEIEPDHFDLVDVIYEGEAIPECGVGCHCEDS